MKLENKIALITGAGSGIGKAIALEMGSAGAHIAVNDLTAETAEATACEVNDFGREALVIPADVADSGQVEDMVQQTLDRFGRIDILVNNAGVYNSARWRCHCDYRRSVAAHSRCESQWAFLL